MKITIIFPARDFEIGKPTMPVMPLAPTLLAALTPQEHEISLIDMFYGDQIDCATNCDLVAITVRTPLAVVAYNIADKFAANGTSVVLDGPHIFAFPNEAKKHAAAVAIGETNAHNVISDLFSLPDKIPHELFGDLTTGNLPTILMCTCGGSIERIKFITANKDVDDYCRISALNAMAYAVVEGFASREEVIRKLSGLLSIPFFVYWTGKRQCARCLPIQNHPGR